MNCRSSRTSSKWSSVDERSGVKENWVLHVTMEMTRRVVTYVAKPEGTRAPMGELIKRGRPHWRMSPRRADWSIIIRHHEPPPAYRRNRRLVSPLRNACAAKSATLRRASALENTFSASASAGATTLLTNDDPSIGVSVPLSRVRAARKISAAVIRRASRASLYPPCGPRTPLRV